MDRLLKFADRQGFEQQLTLVITPAADVVPAAQLLDPMGLAFNEQGTLWVSNSGQDSLVGYTADQLTGSGEQAEAPALLIEGTDGAGNTILSERNWNVIGTTWNKNGETFATHSS